MSPFGATKLELRVLLWQVAFAAGAAFLVAPLVPRLLLLSPALQSAATRVLLYAVGTGGVVALVHNAIVLSRHRELLSALGAGRAEIEPGALALLCEDQDRVVTGWLAPPLAGLALSGTLFRPALLDATTAVSVALLGTVFVAAASLPLSLMVRAEFARVCETAAPDVMRVVMEDKQNRPLVDRHLPRRLLFAVALPVAFISVGAGLVTNAVVRRADERNREAIARLLARATLDSRPDGADAAGVEEAVLALERAGYVAELTRRAEPARVEHERGTAVEVSTPLEAGTARVRFATSDVGVFSPVSMVVAFSAVLLAALVGLGLGRVLHDDLRTATRGVRLLGTDSVIGGNTRVMRPVRFRLIEELGLAIERLADRFRIFARAQERAISARERAARMRGLFFASVSHDLKSPLNAILGFTDLVRATEDLTPGQTESVELISKRGRELLALIETILDASRVEARLLTLSREQVKVTDLFQEALAKGRDLGGDGDVEVVAEVVDGVPDLEVDRLRLTRALATIIGHALRSSERAYVRMRAAPSRAGGARIDVEVPSTRLTARELAGMLDPNPNPGEREHRGLALGLSLARAIIELHGGTVNVTDRGQKGSVFTVRLPVSSAS
ncbi:MAG: HAMP domain-containing sensor histidine kinase [Polyangiaceae bacterium]